MARAFRSPIDSMRTSARGAAAGARPPAYESERELTESIARLRGWERRCVLGHKLLSEAHLGGEIAHATWRYNSSD